MIEIKEKENTTWKCPRCSKPVNKDFVFVGTYGELKDHLVDLCGCTREVEDKCQEI